MKLQAWLVQVTDLHEATSVEAVVSLARAMLADEELTAYERGRLLASFIESPAAKMNPQLAEAALIGGLFESPDLATPGKALGLLEEAVQCLREADTRTV